MSGGCCCCRFLLRLEKLIFLCALNVSWCSLLSTEYMLFANKKQQQQLSFVESESEAKPSAAGECIKRPLRRTYLLNNIYNSMNVSYTKLTVSVIRALSLYFPHSVILSISISLFSLTHLNFFLIRLVKSQ